MALAKKNRKKSRKKKQTRLIYELKVDLIGGPVTEEFVEKNPQVHRIIAIRSDQTLEDLHWAIYDAFDRDEDHMYQFEIGGKEPMDPAAHIYTIPDDMFSMFDSGRRQEDAAKSKIGMLPFKGVEPFYYWFDFGDDWWHEITILSISKTMVKRAYPIVLETTGDSPPLYPDFDDDYDDDEEY